MTEMVTSAALSAVTGPVNALKAPAMKQLRREAAAISLGLNVQGMAFVRAR